MNAFKNFRGDKMLDLISVVYFILDNAYRQYKTFRRFAINKISNHPDTLEKFLLSNFLWSCTPFFWSHFMVYRICLSSPGRFASYDMYDLRVL